MIRLLFLALLLFIAWLVLRRWLRQQSASRPPPPAGFSAEPEALVRCDRCGIRIPSSQIETVRRNCRQCGDERSGS